MTVKPIGICSHRQLMRYQLVEHCGSKGFTLIEMLIVIALLALLASVGIPSYSDMTLGSRLRSEANDLMGGAMLARSEAIKRNQPVSLCASDNGTSCTGAWVDGWIVTNGATVITKHAAARNGFHINSAVTNIIFQPTGVGSTSAELTVCRAAPSVGGQERQVTISSTGRVKVERESAGLCP